MGDVTYSQPSVLGPRIQTGLQMVCVYSGTISLEAGPHRYVLRAGEATLLTPGRRERFVFGQKEPTRHGWYVLNNPALTAPELARLEKLPLRIPFSPAMQALDQLAQSLSATDRALAPFRSQLMQAMLLLYVGEAGGLPFETTQSHPVITRSIHWMEQQLGVPVTIRQIAAQTGVSQTHLIRLYRQAGLPSPKQYLWQLRTQAAAQLLLETGLTASEIAYRTGFSNPYHFSRLFKRYQKQPPGRFRKAGWQPAP